MNGNLCKGGDEVDDKHIVELYWQRSENALYETSSKYGKLCLHIAKNMLWNLEDAEECVNDTYLQRGILFHRKNQPISALLF